MTIAFCAASPGFIVMTADSAVTLDFGDHREYMEGNKTYYIPGVGCVTTWGARDHNRIGNFLQEQNISASTHSVHDLADLVYRFLTEEYRPHELELGDVGYHVAGFDASDRACVSHIFWGFDRPRPAAQTARKYERYDHSPSEGTTVFLYNGRNDLAESVVRTLISEIQSGKETRFDTRTALGLGCFGDFVARFAGELTPEVGPPFITHLISMNNLGLRIENKSFCPIDPAVVLAKLQELGYRSA